MDFIDLNVLNFMERIMIRIVLIFIYIIGCVAQVGVGVKINKLKVPEVIKHGTSVILDCDYTLEVDDDDLVVKWFFQNKNRTLVYQWIPGSSKRPQESGILKNRLNLEYTASVDANSVHRALYIMKPGPELSGDYTCSVSTLQSEDYQTKSMLVYVPEKNLVLKVFHSGVEFTKVVCTAERAFPKPEISLRFPEFGEISDTQIDVKQEGLLYTIVVTAILPTPLKPTNIICELHIAEANYTRIQETVLFPGSSKASQNFTWSLVTVLMIVVSFISSFIF